MSDIGFTFGLDLYLAAGLAFALLALVVVFGLWLLAQGRARRAEARAAALEEARAALSDELKDSEIAGGALKARLDELTSRLGETAADLEATETALLGAREAGARLEAEAKALREAHAGEVGRLNDLQAGLKMEFEALAAKAFTDHQRTFLDQAKAVFEQQKETQASHSGEQREKLQAMIAPIADQLKRYEEGLKAFDEKRQESFSALKTELGHVIAGQAAVSKEASRLVQALKARPTVRGRWGEEQLKTILELAGMSAHIDFDLQASFAAEDGLKRPDVVLRLPGGRTLVIDAKTALDAYLDAVDAVEEADRAAHLKRHARHMRQHMEGLAAKAYSDHLKRHLGETPDFVVMFVPGENFLSAAAEHDAALFQDAFAKGVILTTPATLLALAKAVAYGWRQEKVAENARHVAELGRELYQRLAVMGSGLAALGKAIEAAAERYNKFVGSLEGSVMPQARRFVDLEVAPADKPLPALEPSETAIRPLRLDRDLKFEAEPAAPLKVVPRAPPPTT